MAKPSREDYKRLDLAYKNPSHLMHKKMKLVLNHVGWGKFLIDIGCGTGEFIIQLRDRFNTLVGIDTNLHAIEFTAGRVGKDNNILLKCGELDSFHFPAEQFDVCLCLDVLEHVKDVPPLLQGNTQDSPSGCRNDCDRSQLVRYHRIRDLTDRPPSHKHFYTLALDEAPKASWV